MKEFLAASGDFTHRLTSIRVNSKFSSPLAGPEDYFSVSRRALILLPSLNPIHIGHMSDSTHPARFTMHPCHSLGPCPHVQICRQHVRRCLTQAQQRCEALYSSMSAADTSSGRQRSTLTLTSQGHRNRPLRGPFSGLQGSPGALSSGREC